MAFTFEVLASELAAGNGHLQGVLDNWPDEVDGFGDLEHAIALVGKCADELDAAGE